MRRSEVRSEVRRCVRKGIVVEQGEEAEVECVYGCIEKREGARCSAEDLAEAAELQELCARVT
jgi:hypothetical protein